MKNLFKDLSPSFGPFAKVFDSWVSTTLALVWACGFVFAAYHLIIAVGAIASARRHHRADGEATVGRLVWPGLSLIALALVPTIYAALVS